MDKEFLKGYSKTIANFLLDFPEAEEIPLNITWQQWRRLLDLSHELLPLIGTALYLDLQGAYLWRLVDKIGYMYKIHEIEEETFSIAEFYKVLQGEKSSYVLIKVGEYAREILTRREVLEARYGFFQKEKASKITLDLNFNTFLCVDTLTMEYFQVMPGKELVQVLERLDLTFERQVELLKAMKEHHRGPRYQVEPRATYTDFLDFLREGTLCGIFLYCQEMITHVDYIRDGQDRKEYTKKCSFPSPDELPICNICRKSRLERVERRVVKY
jgi:hypothetical protein